MPEDKILKVPSDEYFGYYGCGTSRASRVAKAKLGKEVLIVDYEYNRLDGFVVITYRLRKPAKKLTFKSGKMERK